MDGNKVSLDPSKLAPLNRVATQMATDLIESAAVEAKSAPKPFRLVLPKGKKGSGKNKSEKPMFLTIDHRLALRRRHVGGSIDDVTGDDSVSSLVVPPIGDKNRAQQCGVEEETNGHAKCHTQHDGQMGQNLIIKMSQMARPILVGTFMATFMAVVTLYTWITLPVYYVIQKPWRRRSKNRRCRVKVWTSSDKSERPMTEAEEEEEKHMSPIYERAEVVENNHKMFEMATINDMLNHTSEVHGADYVALGYRQVLSEEESLDEHGKARRMDGRQLRRYQLSEYKWLNYGQVNAVTSSIAQGLMAHGITSSDKVLIISETRVEWMLCAQAIIRSGATIVTLFSNLGVDGVSHGINETEVKTVIASTECLSLLRQVLDRQGHSVERIIYIDGFRKPDLEGLPSSITITALSEVEKLGKQTIEAGQSKPLPPGDLDKVMIIMYTSGTTGTPKAALMTQRQFVASLHALFVLVKDVIQLAPQHTYVSYLPMAHVLELTVEFFFFIGGVRIGYASPFTLTDSAPGLAAKEKSDIKLLRPTVITAVPLVLDRILKEVNEKLRARTPVSQPVFKFLMAYKSRWTRLGYSCDIVRRLLCSKVQEQLGGALEYMIVGGAPLNANTQATIKSALDVTLIQGYGATETTGAVLCMDFDDLEYGRVGAPLGNVKFRLRNWPEGNYFFTDKPNPRGEIIMGGDLIARGYFKMPRQTEEVFYTDRHGIRWFRTGDVGEMYSNGTIKIIDRCKDLIKLQNGEYISLGKVEAALKSCQYIDNVCVYGGTFSSDIVALISPNRKALEELAVRLDRQQLTLRELCDDEQIEATIFEEVVKSARAANLGKKEIPLRIRLVPDEWSPDNGILTAALKLKRRVIETQYKKELYDLYNEKKIKVVTSKQYDQNNNSVLPKNGHSITNGVTNKSTRVNVDSR